jgi:hypothetical protein
MDRTKRRPESYSASCSDSKPFNFYRWRWLKAQETIKSDMCRGCRLEYATLREEVVGSIESEHRPSPRVAVSPGFTQLRGSSLLFESRPSA